MEIKVADSFTKSLKRLIWHQHPVYKFYEFFRYKLPQFFKNIWFFRKELWVFRSWDYSFNLMMLRRSLEKTVDTIEYHGHEVDISRMKKVEKMKRVIELLGHIREDDYIEMAEKEIGKLKDYDLEFEPIEGGEGYELLDTQTPEDKAHNKKVYERAREIEEQEWNEIWTILKGQDLNEYHKILESMSDEERMKGNGWNKWFDGSGMKHWWD